MSLAALGLHFSKLRCEALFALKPPGLKGSISLPECRFLHQRILMAAPDRVVELGTCSGLSTAIIADALELLDTLDGKRREVISYDSSTTCFFDRSQPIGYFLDHAPAALRARIRIRTKCTAIHVAEDVPPGSLSYLFIDAAHWHPWPALDLLVTLPLLTSDAEVCFHDVNLPLANPQFPDYGVKYLFDALILDKCYAEPTPGRVSNMGSVRLSGNRDLLREQILACIRDNPWQRLVQREWLVAAGVYGEVEEAWVRESKRLPRA